MDRLSLVRPKSGPLSQGRYALLGEIAGLDKRVLLIDVDFLTIHTHLRVDDIEVISDETSESPAREGSA